VNLNIEITEKCEGFWSCLNPSDWFQLAAVIIAMFAAIASFITIRQQKKQFELSNIERANKYKPMYKINYFDFNGPTKLIIELNNEGFQFFIPEKVEWKGKKDLVCNFIKGDVKRKVGQETVDVYEGLILVTDIPIGFTDEGVFVLIGSDIENTKLELETPKFIFENREIINKLQLSKQYLK